MNVIKISRKKAMNSKDSKEGCIWESLTGGGR